MMGGDRQRGERGDAGVGQGRGAYRPGDLRHAEAVRLRSTTAKGSGSWPGTLPIRGSGQAEPSCAAQQVLNRGGMPSRSAARRPFMHGLELGSDLLQRPIGRRRFDARDQADQPVVAWLRPGAVQQGRLDDAFRVSLFLRQFSMSP